MELIGKQIAIETILGQPPELHYPSWYAAQIEKLPPAPPEYLAEQAGILATDSDTISRKAAIDAIDEISREVDDGDGFDYAKWRQYFCELPPAQFATDTNVGTKHGTNLAEVGTDCISRQAAIKACGGYLVPANIIRELPPAQPNVHDLAKDADCISRRVAITALSNEIVKRRLLDEMYDGCIDEFQTEEILKKLPSAQPERIRGRWIIRETSSGDTEARCSHCGFTTLVDEPGNGLHMVSDLNFCPNCGADMREVTI